MHERALVSSSWMWLAALTLQVAVTPCVRAQSGAVRLGGEFQTRYVVVRRGAGPDTLDAGFQLRRARLIVTGWVLDPRLTFRLRPSYDRAVGNLQFDDAWMAYGADSGLKVQVGQYKPEIFREEIIGNFRELAVEASYASTYFGLDYTQAAQVMHGAGPWRAAMVVHDGAYGANTDFQADRADIAVAARVDVVPFGSRAAFAGSSGWSNVAPGLLVGAAADWERGQRRDSRSTPEVLKLTADVSALTPGASALAALYYQKFRVTWLGSGPPLPTLPPNLDGVAQWGAVAQAGVFAIPDRVELLARYEWLDFGGVYYRNSAGAMQAGSRTLGVSRLRVVTAGLNWYLQRDEAKLSLDVMATGDPVPVDNSGVGLLRYDRGNEVVLRTQLQWRF